MKQSVSVVMTVWILSWAGCANSGDPVSFLKRYVELHRARDINGLLSLHTTDAEFVIPGQDTIRGTKALRDLFEWDSVLGSELTMRGIHALGDTIFIDLIVEGNKWFQSFGLEEVRYRPGTRIVLRNGLIVGTYPSTLDDATLKILKKRFETFIHWLRENRQDALDQLLPGGKFQYNAVSARLWLEVLAEWNRSIGQKR